MIIKNRGSLFIRSAFVQQSHILRHLFRQNKLKYFPAIRIITLTNKDIDNSCVKKVFQNENFGKIFPAFLGHKKCFAYGAKNIFDKCFEKFIKLRNFAPN